MDKKMAPKDSKCPYPQHGMQANKKAASEMMPGSMSHMAKSNATGKMPQVKK